MPMFAEEKSGVASKSKPLIEMKYSPTIGNNNR